MNTRATLQTEIPVERWLSLSQVFSAIESERGSFDSETCTVVQAQLSWHTAITAMSQLLKHTVLAPNPGRSPSPHTEVCNQQGVLLCGPSPVFGDLAILAHLKTWVFTPEGQTHKTFQLPPANPSAPSLATHSAPATIPAIALPLGDPLTHEQFCLIQTPQFCWVAILGMDTNGISQFQFSFEPVTVQEIWNALQLRIDQTPRLSLEINSWQQRFPPIPPDYRIPTQFSRELLSQFNRLNQSSLSIHPISEVLSRHPEQSRGQTQTTASASHTPLRSHPSPETEPDAQLDNPEQSREVELLKALSHEVRTPLSTIQTLTRLLLKRSDLPSEAMKRIEAIQKECMGQIDRFGLIFRAMELTHDDCQTLPSRLTPISLAQVLEENLSRWQTQAARRNLTLEISTPELLPAIAITDPQLLDQVLTGLMEYLSYSLPLGSHIHLQVDLAGSQLKLQLQTQSDETQPDILAESPILKAVGKLLMFQPETGGLSLSLPATKHLFQALGGKLTVRKHHHSEVLTIFLPLGPESDAY